jgi:predicted phosphohydrolase
MIFGFDVISDLNLTLNDEFDWSEKPTSLFCIVAGNISTDMRIVAHVLKNLSQFYHGVFFVDGTLEVNNLDERDRIVTDLQRISSASRNIVYLHNNVVVVDGIALVGINGWFKNFPSSSTDDEFQLKCNRFEDFSYLEKTIEKLQLHNDVKKIIVISNSAPSEELYFGECGSAEDIYPAYVLQKDSEHKVSHWVYGTYKKEVDIIKNNVNYVNNGKFDRNPYYAKRIEIRL